MAVNAKSIGYAEQVSAPANPTAGNRKTYFKTNGKMYQLNSSGTETEIGSGSSPGGTSVGGTVYQYKNIGGAL